MLHHKKNGIYTNFSVFVYPKFFPQPAISRSDEGPSPGPDDNAVQKC